MGKKKQTGEYNDFLDGEKLRDNGDIRTSLQNSSTTQDTTPPLGRQDRSGSKRHGKGKGGPKKPPLTHFLCLPLVTDASRDQLQKGLEKLKGDLEEEAIVPPKAVRPLGTLHLTLGVMSLDDTKLEEATQYLSNLSLHRLLRDLTQRGAAEKAAEDGTISENLNAAALPDTDGLTIDLEALTPMQSPQKTSILYASPVDPTHRLVAFALALRKEFTERGFMVEDTRPLKLHATIINTIYAKPNGRSGRGRKSTVKETLKHIEHKVSPHHRHHHHAHPHSPANSHTINGVHSPNDKASHASPPPPPDSEDENIDKSEGHGPNATSWLRFDASDLIERYKDFKWAEGVRIDRVQICKMGARNVWSGGKEGEGEMDERYVVVGERGIFE